MIANDGQKTLKEEPVALSYYDLKYIPNLWKIRIQYVKLV